MERQLLLDGDSEVTASEFGDWLGCSVVTVSELAWRGVIERTSGKYPLKASIRRDAVNMREMVTGRGEGTPAEAKGRLTRAQAEIAEVKARKLAGELIEAEVVLSKWVATMVRLRAALLAVPEPGPTDGPAPHHG